MTFRMSSLATSMMNVRVARLGSGSAVVYLHDVLFDSVSPDGDVPKIVDLLSDSHEVYAPALPGFHDLKQLSAVSSVEDYVLWLDDVIGALGLERPHVVGSGLGGWLAAELAVERPGLFRTLTLVNAFGLRVEGHPINRFFYAAAPNGIDGRKEVRELMFADPNGSVAQEALPNHPEQAANERFFTNVHAASRIGWQPPNFYNPTLITRLHRVTSPTHVIWGAKNVLVDTDHANAYAKGIANATLTTIDGAGHALTVEQPDELTKAIGTFLDQHET